ncbi:hypothetical protein [Paenibacillus sp. FSL H3-0286]|uniref:hypothetical protein n=1 Tax=Paenibacillus sp. FSL H3-0286 TaxID=2921427 RepID=UPI00324D404D
MLTNTEIISSWITEQLEVGKTDDELDGKVFYEDDNVYTIKKTRRKNMFDLKCAFGGAVNLNTLKGKYEPIEEEM